jgi:hypothetical protein
MIEIFFSSGCGNYDENDYSEISIMNTFCDKEAGTYQLSVLNGLDCFYHELNIKCNIEEIK